MKVPIAGGAPTVLASGQSSPTGIAVDGTDVYWTTAAVGNGVMKVAKGGGVPMVVAAEPGSTVVVDATSVYWSGPAGVMKVDKGGGTPTSLLSPFAGFGALDGTSIYWTQDCNQTAGISALMKGTLDGKPFPSSLSTSSGTASANHELASTDGVGYAWGFAVTPTMVYFRTNDGLVQAVQNYY
jgi:hypothetical protein